LVSHNWRFNFADPYRGGFSSKADTTTDTERENALREWLDVLMPWKVEINGIRLQGIRTIDIGGRRGINGTSTDTIATGALPDTTDARDPLPGKVHENFRGAIRTYEVWCNDGYDWLVQEEGDDECWVPATNIVNPGTNAYDVGGFSRVKKYHTFLGKGQWSKIIN
jgi:hypothetical protein